METTPPAATRSTRRQRRWAVSVRAMMVLVLILGGGLGWEMYRVRVQREVVALVKQKGGSVAYDWEWSNGYLSLSGPPERTWLRDRLGDDFFNNIVLVSLDGRQFGDDDLRQVARLERIRGLYVYDTTVTDAGLAHIRGLTHLHTLFLGSNNLTDAGMANLEPLRTLATLLLDGTQVTDAALPHVARLQDLTTLDLSGTQITDAGLKQLTGLTKLRSLNLGATPITDAGLKQLSGLTKLRSLNLRRTPISDAGLEQLRGLTELRELFLRNTQITDQGLARLVASRRPWRYLYVSGSKVTPAGVAAARKLLPPGVVIEP